MNITNARRSNFMGNVSATSYAHRLTPLQLAVDLSVGGGIGSLPSPSRARVSIKDAFNDPALIEYANEQGADISDSLTTPCPNTSQPISIVSKSPSNQSSKPSSSY